MTWCQRCGVQIQSNDGAHNCGNVTISKDRLRDLERIEREANEKLAIRHPMKRSSK